MSETTLWDWLKKSRDHFGKALHIRRVENSVSTGDADADGILNGADFAIELKACKAPARDRTKLTFHEVTDQQVEWHSKRLDAGGASCFLIQVGDERFIVHGRLAPTLQTGISLNWLYVYGTPVATARAAIGFATQQRNP